MGRHSAGAKQGRGMEGLCHVERVYWREGEWEEVFCPDSFRVDRQEEATIQTLTSKAYHRQKLTSCRGLKEYYRQN